MIDANFWVTAPLENLGLEKIQGYTIPDYFRRNMEEWGWGDRVAFECAETGRKYTHNQVLKDSRALAASLLELGPVPEWNLKKADVVAVILPNIPEFASIVFGIWEAGLIATTINPTYIEREMAQQIEASGAKLIFTSPPFLATATSIQRGNLNIQKIVVVDTNTATNEAQEKTVNFFDLLQRDTNGIDFVTGSKSKVNPNNDVALLPYSSGTSGLPKGVMLTQYAILSNAFLWARVQDQATRKGQEKRIAILPFFHLYGFILILVSMIQGFHVLTMPAFNMPLFVRKLQEFKPTFLYVVPTLANMICSSELIGQKELESVTYILSGAAVMGETVVRRLLDKARNASFYEAYGMTEMGPGITVSRVHRIGSVGQPLPELTVKVVDLQTGLALGPGQPGELWAKGPSTMKGYLNNGSATRECIDPEGWFHTGDILYYDQDGWFYIVDRLKELIKVKGFQVSPSELEEVIRGHEKVGDVAVIGIPDDKVGEVPRAYVVPKGGEVLSEMEIIEFVKDRVSNYKHLRGGVELVAEIPKGGSGKILRKVLKEKYVTMSRVEKYT